MTNGAEAVPAAQLLAGAEVVPVDEVLGRRACMLLAASGGSDAVDATVVCLPADGDDILTADPSGLSQSIYAMIRVVTCDGSGR